jgi:hypothetical protein
MMKFVASIAMVFALSGFAVFGAGISGAGLANGHVAGLATNSGALNRHYKRVKLRHPKPVHPLKRHK